MARKSRNSLFDLPPLELECMKALWALGKATVEDIRARLMPTRPLAYTTVMTVMDRLARKGIAQRRKQGRAHLYSSAVAEESVREHAVNRLVENFFAGSREHLRTHLAGAAKSRAGYKAQATPEPARPAKRERAAPRAEKIDPALL
jgi:BlaI family transcriptional regulator, penicillinase repressor